MKTPIEELIKEKQEKYETWFDEFGYAFSYMRMGDFKKAVNEIIEELLTKEKEQREELIREALMLFIENPMFHFVREETIDDFMRYYQKRSN